MTGLPTLAIASVAVLVAGVVIARFADRLGAPALLLFLFLGMLLGEDGPGGFEFDDFELAEYLGVIALAVILFEGGLTADRAHLRRVAVPAGMLASVGVVVTGAVIGLVAVVLLDVPWREGLLLGAVVSCTDAAAVLSAVRGIHLRARLSATLEGESGLNDPLAALATIALVEIITEPDFTLVDGTILLIQQLAIGLAGGVGFGFLARRAIARAGFTSAGLYPVAALATALGCFVVVLELGGSGFLAVYVLGLLMAAGRLPHATVVEGFHAGLAWLAQIALFVLLGLLVDPSELLDEGWKPVVIALALVLVARPLAVVASVGLLGFTWREQAFLAWAGLRGAVPIVFATFPIVEGVAAGDRIFNVVFYVVLVSVVVQGIGLRPVARRLGLADEASRLRMADIDVATLRSMGAELLEVEAGELGTRPGRLLRDTTLPANGIIAVIRRGEQIVQPRGETEIQEGDLLYLLVERTRLREVERAMAPRPAPGRVG